MFVLYNTILIDNITVIITDELFKEEARQVGSSIVYIEDVHHYSPEEGSLRGRLLPLPSGRIKVGSASVLGQQYPITVPVPATFL